ncbi:glycosyltransferase family 8 protein [Bradyrhizobium sp.]|uniref:glycosyltransferase family 8 protein n=1 Tax=Bradyrhizobium sp. TaxID=376 RepID=UPI003C61741F
MTIGDEGYILPGAASAISARRNLSRTDVDVIQYVVVKDQADLVSAVAGRLAPIGISVRPVKIDELALLSSHHTDKAVPVSALTRLWLENFLDNDVEKFLYIDGDVLVRGALDSLFDLVIPRGGLLAADDCLCLYEHEIRQPRRYWQPYLQSIGVAWRDYFNTGVLLVDRAGWKEVSTEAIDFLINKSALCRSSDQTALNAIIGKRRGRLPLRWNYQTEHMMVLDPRKVGVEPAIWHFAGGPKPWDLPEWPWDESFNQAIREAEKILDGLDYPRPPVNRMMFDEGVRHRRRQRNLQRWRFLFRRYRRARQIERAL